MKHEPIAITGRGVVSTLGTTPEALADGLEAGRSGITRWKEMDPRIYSKIGGDLSGFDLAGFLADQGAPERVSHVLRGVPPATAMAAAAALDAARDAEVSGVAPERLGHVIGCHNAHVKGHQVNAQILEEEPDFLEPLFGLWGFDTDIASAIAEVLTARGPVFTVGGACASSNLSICAAVDAIRAGRADAVVAGGVATTASSLALQAWSHLEALSIQSFNDRPTEASRPFDAARDGFVMAEGAAVLVLESQQSAEARGVKPLAELRGYGATSDAHHLTEPGPSGQSAANAIQLALKASDVQPSDLDYLNAHGTSTPLNDRSETKAVKLALGEHAYRVPMSSTKSMTGHLLGAGGALEATFCIMAIKNGTVPPTINLETPDPDCDLDYTPNQARCQRVDVAMSNSFGFGGHNSVLVFANPDQRG